MTRNSDLERTLFLPYIHTSRVLACSHQEKERKIYWHFLFPLRWNFLNIFQVKKFRLPPSIRGFKLEQVMDNTLYLVCVVTRGSSWRSATLAPSGGGNGAYNEANEGQAHHMFSRFLNLRNYGFFSQNLLCFGFFTR